LYKNLTGTVKNKKIYQYKTCKTLQTDIVQISETADEINNFMQPETNKQINREIDSQEHITW